MKQLMAISFAAILCSCHDETVREMKKNEKILVCDSVHEVTTDASGNKVEHNVLRCDSVSAETQK
jgi:hypothetical protein